MKIYVFGDSHAGSFGVHPDIIATPTGPSSMYLIGKEGDVLFADIIKVLIKDKRLAYEGTWILSFGEIDTRCTIYNQVREKGRNEDEITSKLVDDYIKKVKPFYETISISSIVPPVNYSTIGYLDPTWPFIGPIEDRARYVKKINAYLKTKCAENNIPYVDLYKYYADQNGYMDEKYSTDRVHITDSKFILQAIQEAGLLT